MKRLFLAFLILAGSLTAFAAETADLLSVENLVVPESLGKVEGRYFGPHSGRWIIQIQDVHSHLQAQENIAAILEHLNEAYGVRIAGIEGIWSSTAFPKTRKLKGLQREKQTLARILLDEDLLSGPGYASILGSRPLGLVGLEDPSLYEENRKIYVEHLKYHDQIVERFKALFEDLQKEKQSVYNQALLIFDHHLMQYRSGRKVEDFIPALVEQAQARELDVTQMPQIIIFMQALSVEKAIDREKLKAEAERLMQTFRQTGLEFEELLLGGKILEEKLAHYPATQEYRELLKIRGRLQYRTFFDEIEKLVRQFKIRLFASNAEMALDERSEALVLASRIALLQAVPDDVKTFMASSAEIAQPVLAEAGLDQALRLGLSFYKLAKQRDEIFFQKIVRDSRLEGTIAVVTGGFHTDGLSEKLEQAKISYVVVRPELGEQPVNETSYFKRLSESSPGSETLSALRNLYTPAFDGQFAAAVQELRISNDGKRAARMAVTPAGDTDLPAASTQAGLDFGTLTADQQLEIANDLLALQAGKKQITLIMNTSTLKEVLKKPLARTIWHEEILAHRENRVILIKDISEILEDTLGGRVPVRRVDGDLKSVLDAERAKPGGDQFLIGILDAAFAGGDEKTVVLKPDQPAALLLLRPLLEHRNQRLSPDNPEALDLLNGILIKIYSSKGTLRSA